VSFRPLPKEQAQRRIRPARSGKGRGRDSRKGVEAFDRQEKGFDADCGQSLADSVNLPNRDVAKEAEGQMKLFRASPCDSRNGFGETD